MTREVLAAKVPTSKPSFLKPTNVTIILSFLGVILQSTCNLNGAPNNFMNLQLQNQLFRMLMNGILSSLGTSILKCKAVWLDFPT